MIWNLEKIMAQTEMTGSQAHFKPEMLDPSNDFEKYNSDRKYPLHALLRFFYLMKFEVDTLGLP